MPRRKKKELQQKKELQNISNRLENKIKHEDGGSKNDPFQDAIRLVLVDVYRMNLRRVTKVYAEII